MIKKPPRAMISGFLAAIAVMMRRRVNPTARAGFTEEKLPMIIAVRRTEMRMTVVCFFVLVFN
jgi:hypothetical protein